MPELASGQPGLSKPRRYCRGRAGTRQHPSCQAQKWPHFPPSPITMETSLVWMAQLPWTNPATLGRLPSTPRCSETPQIHRVPTVIGAGRDLAQWDISGTVTESLGPLGRAERAQAVQRGPFKPGFTTHCCVTLGKFLNKSEPQFPCAYNLYRKGTPPVASAGGFIEVPHRRWAHMAAEACVTPSSYDTNPCLS